MNNNYLYDRDFLYKLDSNQNKSIYAKITLLTLDELPIEEIQGRVTSGSINVDGASAIRRTCSLSVIIPKVDITNSHWVLNSKFKLDIGVENNIDDTYPNIIWFKQGIFIFTSINMNVQSNNFTVSINGKDKMCLLNGECGGVINAPTDFGQIDEVSKSYYKIELTDETYEPGEYYYLDDNGEYQLAQDAKKKDIPYYKMEYIINTSHIPIKDIIKNILTMYANESIHNIVIEDIENYGLELLEYRGDKDLYFLKNINSDEIQNMTINETQEYYIINNENKYKSIRLGDLTQEQLYRRVEGLDGAFKNGINLYSKDQIDTLKEGETPSIFNAIKIKFGETVGYRKTDLTYPGDLMGNVGESVVTILDKIKNMFADYEYFYDIEGRFIFQKKRLYLNKSWNNIQISEDSIFVENSQEINSYVYSFEDGKLLTAFSNVPNMANIKNDFSIWGKRKGVSGIDLEVHLRYAIDQKPVCYIDYLNKNAYINSVEVENIDVDKIKEAGINTVCCDWRELIYQMAVDYQKNKHKDPEFLKNIAKNNPEYFPTGITGYEQYYTDMYTFWRQLYNPSALQIKEKETIILPIEEGISTGEFSTKTGFNIDVIYRPEVLNFWFDFMDVQGELSKYSIQAIGHRPKAVKDDKINAIYFQSIPMVLFLSEKDQNDLDIDLREYYSLMGYTWFNMPQKYENYFVISAQGQSANDKLYSLLNEHIVLSENVTLTTVPIYHLQPNNRIMINDKNTNTIGEYTMSKITVPLTYNGTSSITASKVINKIY